ncbi:MAG: hypothetical protein JWM68_3522 [Verrucomicrobiales bacterium]|nr:hypothetical protein [Verrucomicrobiales bacterium]
MCREDFQRALSNQQTYAKHHPLPGHTYVLMMKYLLGGLLALSLVLNVFLWNRLSSQSSNQLKRAQEIANEIHELQRQNQERQSTQASAPSSANPDTRELARLRNEVGQLRKQAGDATTLRAQAAEAAQLRAQLATATQNLAEAENGLAQAVKLSPEEMQQLKTDAHASLCVNNLKQISVAARMWATDNQNLFPPDLISLKDELQSPKVLFCPADTVNIPVTKWSQLTASSISYRLLNANGNISDPTKVLLNCPIHGHVALSDGSVQRQ